jgi:hypothetical protein
MVKFENEPNTSVVVEQVINVVPKSYEIFIQVISSKKYLVTTEKLIKKL